MSNADKRYIVAVVAIGMVGVVGFAFRTIIPGGIGMLPLWLLAVGFVFAICVQMWRHRDSF